MTLNKLQRFAAIDKFPNVLQKPVDMKDKWEDFWGNKNPVTLELACGKGEYSVNLGRKHPDRNFLGVDVKGNRIYIGAKTALDEGLKNVGFLRTQINNLNDYFHDHSIDKIWIIFPDPFLKDIRAKNRLTHTRFLTKYQKLLKPGATINLKTDSRELFDFTLEMIEENNCSIVDIREDIYNNNLLNEELSIQTFYEKMHLGEGRKINFVSYKVPEKDIIYIKKKKEADDRG